MGEHETWAQPSGLLPNGLLPNQGASVSRVLNSERWSKAEKRTAELMACIQPNQPSEVRRNAVASYVQMLIMKCFSCGVFTFGSVPLKTYLPDGDIDLTACSNNEKLKDTWANAVREVLENEEKNENAEFRIKEVQYIQAEVKLIKCLVDNIVVDISFNQVGGLCTLCFLEEVDDLINQNHLFKRSIILIKAWCYYESRILGAHHGLISTYALEILVLYIFHVFNNSFAGPLEVLYRFLEFFSNFDWDHFCVSLWGPVPISSLPDMIAEPPRKDNGKLFLSEGFLHDCNKKYGVILRDQESQTQPFVSKHFNVIDPLRTNNNLGRSVGKGNFFRIRSAFAFGAKRLARLLECPMEDIIAEVNQFFMNTQERHGSGHRPDAPSLDLRHLQPLRNVQIEVNNSKSITNVKTKIENVAMRPGHGVFGVAHDSQDSSSEINITVNRNCQNGTSNCNTFLVSRSRGQNYYSGQTNSRVSDQFEGNNSSSGSVHSEKSQKMFKPNNALDEERQGRFQFTRTRSSPELTQSALEFSRGKHSRTVETRKIEDSPTEIDFSNRRKRSGPTPMRQSSSHKSLEVVSTSNNAPNNLHGDFDFGTVGEELASVSETLEMQQEEQDLINMMESSNIHSFNGQVQFPMHVASHFPLALSPMPTPIGIFQRNWAGVYPTTLSLIGPSWGSDMQFSPGLVSAPLSQYFRDATLSSNQNDAVEFVNEGSPSTELNSEDSDQNIWQENDAGTSRSFNSEDNSYQMLHLDSKQRKPHYGLHPIRTSRSTTSGALARGQHKFTREERHVVRENEIDSFQNQRSRGTDNNSNFRGANMRFFQASQATSISKPETENFSDGSVENVPKLVREKWERRQVFPPAVASSFGQAKSGSQFESSSDHVLPDFDDETTTWTPLSSEGTDMSERTTGSSTFASASMSSQVLHGFEPAQITGSDQFIQFAPVLVGTSQQSGIDNAKVLPFFFPTGPPFPFVMVPVCESTAASQFKKGDEVDHCGVSSSDANVDSVESSDHSDVFLSSAASRVVEPELSDEHKSDILNSDRNSHWENLEYGRLCQNSHYHGPLICPPLVVPPLYLEGQYPWDGPGRPISANLNLTQVMGYGPPLVPMIPLQPGSDRASGGFQHCGDEAPRSRGGTGTYLPNTKVSLRERQSSSRIHRGNYNYERHDHGDREGSWVSSKQRASGRSHARSQAERPSSRPDRVPATENHVDRQWESHRHVPASSYMVQNSSFGSTNSSHGSGNMVGTYAQSALSPMGPTNPPYLVYSYDQGGVGDGSSAEPLEFGSLGPVHLLKGHMAPRLGDGFPASGTSYEQRHGTYRVASQRLSPDQPSSPQRKR